MTVEVNGVTHWTVAEVAKHFGVAPKTVHSWIKARRVDPPPTTWRGFRRMRYFPQEWVRKAETVVPKGKP